MDIVKEKKFYKLLLSIALPIAFQNLITFSVGMADSLMIGTMGEVPLSAVTLANQLFFIFMILNFGISNGSNILVAQYWGKGEVENINKVIAIMYRTCIIFSILFMVIAICFPGEFLSIFSKDPLVVEEGIKYLRIVGWGYMFFGLTNCSITVLRSIKTVNISFFVYIVSLVVNIFFNYIFIFGKFGAPSLGAQGAAIGTLIARIVEFLIVIIYLFKYETKLKLRINKLLKINPKMLKKFTGTCTPVIFNELLWAGGASIISLIIARLGTEAVAANSINGMVNQFATLFIFGVSSATGVVIGNMIGEGKYEEAQKKGKAMTFLAGIMGLISGLLIFTLKGYIVDLYQVSDVTKEIALNMMNVTAVIVVFQSLAHTTMIGVLRGGGDVKFVLINDVIFMWLIAIPLGFAAAYVFELPIYVIFLVLKSDEILKTIASTIRVLRGKWIKDVTLLEQ